MKDVKSLMIKLPSDGLTNLCRLAVVACMAVTLAAGCHKAAQHGGISGDAPEHGIVPTDPEVAANLGNLTMELHKALHHHSQGFSNFDEFVSYDQLQPPPPPSGTEYAISKTFQIVLVQAKK